MSTAAIIAVAITGAVPRKADNPAVPITPEEQVESTKAAFEAGAALVHIHVRNDDETSSSDPARFAAVQDGIRKHCPGMIIQFSTGGRGRAQDERATWHRLPPARSISPIKSTKTIRGWSKRWPGTCSPSASSRKSR
jgi:3-keto-5-aminohexanoate cleavage enzyme